MTFDGRELAAINAQSRGSLASTRVKAKGQKQRHNGHADAVAEREHAETVNDAGGLGQQKPADQQDGRDHSRPAGEPTPGQRPLALIEILRHDQLTPRCGSDPEPARCSQALSLAGCQP